MTLRLLLIDDDELDRLMVLRALRGSPIPFDVMQSATATDGLTFAATQHFDAILLDYRLPDQNGLEVLKILRAGEYEGVAVIMLSHQEDDKIIDQCLEIGAQDFLLKSEVNGRHLARAIRQAKQRYKIEKALLVSREQLRQLAEHDPLTGLTNRRGFEIAMETAIARVRRGHGGLGLLLLDLDDFKSINDTLGHDAGDELLISIARRLREVVRESDVLCRLGGDEFVVLAQDLEHDEQIVLLADRILSKFKTPIRIGESERCITTSIGIAVLDRSSQATETPVDLLKCADVAMYQAKQEGRNQSRFYSDALQQIVLFRACMKNDMHKALENNEFSIYYQAQIKAADGALGGVEALLRWQHPRLGMITPEAFMPIAEETKMIVPIGFWVLKEACRQLKEWRLRHPLTCPDLTIAVNLSAIQLKQNALPATVKSILIDNQLEAQYLELEITENALIEDASGTVALLSAITSHGVTFSLDDFGTGYSSFEHLKLFPISVLKIDKGFVSTIGHGQSAEKLLVAIIAFAKALDMKIVAEGIETELQAIFCIQNGCDLLQGYYFSRPVPAEAFESTFLTQKKNFSITAA